MAWIAENWFWTLVFIAFMAMHMFGHGGHGGHGGRSRHRHTREAGKDEQKERLADPRPGGHQH